MDNPRGIKENGQALVEFALVLGLLLVFIFGMTLVGYYIHAQQIVAAAARTGARQAALTLDESKAVAAVKESLVSIDAAENKTQISVVFPNGTARGQEVSVRVAYTMPFTFGFLNSFIGSTAFRTVRSDSVAIIECREISMCSSY